MESSVNSQQLVRLLADANRRKLVAALVITHRETSATEVAGIAGMRLRDVIDAADRLIGGGLVDGDADGYVLLDERFQQAARADAPASAASDHADQPDDVARVLDVAFRDGKLVQWPAKRTNRLVVLDYLAQQFDIGTRYSEPDVNDLLRPFNDDVATTRRYLVDEQFLDRANGEYWRCGGSF